MTDFDTAAIVADVDVEGRAKARMTVERHALDPQDFQMLVEMLDL